MADVTNIQDALKEIMEQYKLILSPVVAKTLVKQTNKTARDEAEAISHDAPRRKSSGNKSYADGFTIRKASTVGSLRDVEAIVYNNKKANLTHLLEYGHNITDADGVILGHAPAYPHIKPNEDKFNKIYVDTIETLLKRYMGG